MKTSCATCAYFIKRDELPSGVAQCVRYPPVPMFTPSRPSPANPQGLTLSAVFPLVSASTVCGEHLDLPPLLSS